MTKGVPVLAAVLLLLPVAGWSQSPSVAEAARKARRQRTNTPRKIWTNDDFPSLRKAGRKSLPVATQEKDSNKSPSEFAVELVAARKQLLSEQETLAEHRAALSAREADLRNATDDYDRQTYSEAIDFNENAIRETEEKVKVLKGKVTSLEDRVEADKVSGPVKNPASPSPR